MALHQKWTITLKDGNQHAVLVPSDRFFDFNGVIEFSELDPHDVVEVRPGRMIYRPTSDRLAERRALAGITR